MKVVCSILGLVIRVIYLLSKRSTVIVLLGMICVAGTAGTVYHPDPGIRQFASWPDSSLNMPGDLHRSDDSFKVQFAVVSDLWGGYRPGVFEDAVNKLELLQPQFVMSVGDLIDGDTCDSVLIKQQWDEFMGLIDPLSMPFCLVPGNHDIANPLMEREWKRRFGTPYYSFTSHDLLFLCLNTEDGGSSGIGEEQIAYFKEVIEREPDAAWIFLFMHRPVWLDMNGNNEGYEMIEAALMGHNYTVFSGHRHTYLYEVKHGNKHFILGSTGGGSDLRGEEFGEFDHITWVTVEGGKSPKIVNLKLDGILFEDVVNGNSQTFILEK